MRKLDRISVSPPACIVPHNPCLRFSQLSGNEKAKIRSALLGIQKECCAYCERRTGTAPNDGHIEHFQNQSGHGHLETDWNNLFWSCNDEKTCGKHKDKCNRPSPSGRQRSFNPADIIKPCTDDPEHFMMFVPDGTIVPRPGLNAYERRRYDETVRVFQLADSPFLRRSREDAVKPYIGALDALRLAGPKLFHEYIVGELAQIDSKPFRTAIKHFLKG